MNNFLALDLESGGIGEDKTLLTLYMAVMNENYEIQTELDLKIKPDNGIYNVTAEALSINKIDLVEHDKTAITYKEAGSKVYRFLDTSSKNGIIKLIPLGHGINMDCRFLYNTIISHGSWNKFVSFRYIDTGVISRFLILTEKLPELSCSLESLAKHFQINIELQLHNAKTDTMISIEIFKRLVELNK